MRKRNVLAIVATVIGLGTAGVATAISASAAQGVYIQVVNSISGKCADVAGQSVSPGAFVHQWTCDNDANQLWFQDTANLPGGRFRLVNKNSGLCMTAPRPPLAGQVTTVFQWPCGEVPPGFETVSEFQTWSWQPADAGHSVLSSEAGQCLALFGVYSARNGWGITVHDCATTNGQFWHAG